MGRKATFTAAQIERATRGARRADPTAVIEVTGDGLIRILPGKPEADTRSDLQKRIDKWFEDDES